MARQALELRPVPASDRGDARSRTREGMPDLYAYAHLLAEEKRRGPGDDVMSIPLSQVDDGGEVSVAEFENMFWLFAVARNETMRNGLPGACIALLEHAGGKLTTYRVMARDVIDAAARDFGRAVPESVTAELPLLGADWLPGIRAAASRLTEDYGVGGASVEHMLGSGAVTANTTSTGSTLRVRSRGCGPRCCCRRGIEWEAAAGKVAAVAEEAGGFALRNEPDPETRPFGHSGATTARASSHGSPRRTTGTSLASHITDRWDTPYPAKPHSCRRW
jgi:hypothetical protein